MDMENPLRREPIADRGISVTVPACNAAKNLEAVVTGVSSVLEGMGRGYEVIIVNDGSTDSTAAVAERLVAANKRVRLIHHAAREGYGAALRSGFRAVKYPLVLQLDGDNHYDATQIDKLLGEINQVDAVCGYRANLPNDAGGFGSWAYRWLLRTVFAVRVRDVDCGFRLYRRTALRRIPIQSNGSFANAEIVAKANFMNLLVAEVAVNCFPRASCPAALPREFRRNMLRDAVLVFRYPQFCTPRATTDRLKANELTI